MKSGSVEWTPKLRRTGAIAKKIGVVPLWLKDGTKIQTTLLQVISTQPIVFLRCFLIICPCLDC